MVERSELPVTYGGEVEMLAIKHDNGLPVPFDDEVRTMVQDALRHVRDIQDKHLSVGYDSSRHLIEIGAGVHSELARLVGALKEAISTVERILWDERHACLLSVSFHPTEDMATAYKNVLPKPIYDLWRGVYNGQHRLKPDVLGKVYPSEPEKGRGWQHQFTAMSTSIQPWNSLEIETAADQLAVLQATSWMFNLLTANSPFAEKRRTGKRDVRLDIWEPMLSTSRYKNDAQLIKNLPTRPRGLTDYYRHVFGYQRLMAIPCAEVQTTGSIINYKKCFRAVVQCADQQEFSVLDYLSADYVSVVDVERGEVEKIRSSVSHVFNGYDFLYFPRYGARLRVQLPYADSIDARAFAAAIRSGDEMLLRDLFIQGGVKDGFICVEGRVPATNLPTQAKPDWKRFCIPFVLQTALLRKHEEVLALLLDETGLEWQQLVEVLPARTNRISSGFKTQLRGVQATELAQQLWLLVQGSLSREERELVGDEIDEILSRQKAPAEEQLDLMADLSDAASDAVRDDAFARLIKRYTVCTTSQLVHVI
ncbi:MAG TPA: hypothetical protein VEL31_10945 [Ktedonobacteraceae bacterium]|nr:hypothetical protein [Ktedonobacteraceae bacterium]